jgi:class 3 adenylate cyclase
VGVGIHSGPAYVGTVGSGESVNEIAVLGNDANLTARLSSTAAQGEVLISQEALQRSDISEEGMEKQILDLKGVSNKVVSWGLRVEPDI